jgi:hypothetical protein
MHPGLQITQQMNWLINVRSNGKNVLGKSQRICPKKYQQVNLRIQ